MDVNRANFPNCHGERTVTFVFCQLYSKQISTIEEILAAVLNSEDESDEIQSPSSDDSIFDNNTADTEESEDELQSIGDKIEHCFKAFGLICDVSSLISQFQFLHILFFLPMFIKRGYYKNMYSWVTAILKIAKQLIVSFKTLYC